MNWVCFEVDHTYHLSEMLKSAQKKKAQGSPFEGIRTKGDARKNPTTFREAKKKIKGPTTSRRKIEVYSAPKRERHNDHQRHEIGVSIYSSISYTYLCTPVCWGRRVSEAQDRKLVRHVCSMMMVIPVLLQPLPRRLTKSHSPFSQSRIHGSQYVPEVGLAHNLTNSLIQ